MCLLFSPLPLLKQWHYVSCACDILSQMHSFSGVCSLRRRPLKLQFLIISNYFKCCTDEKNYESTSDNENKGK